MNLTFASGSDDLDGSDRDPGFNDVKLGYQTKDLLKAGTTSCAVDFYDGQDQSVDGSSWQSISAFVVHKVDAWNTEFYGGYRTYDVTTTTTAYRNVDVVFVGARFTF